MSSKAQLLEQMSLAEGRVAERPTWMREMLSQARQAEQYVLERDGKSYADASSSVAVAEPTRR